MQRSSPQQLCAHNWTSLWQEQHRTTSARGLTQQEPEEEHAVATLERKVSEWEEREKQGSNRQRGKSRPMTYFLEAVCQQTLVNRVVPIDGENVLFPLEA